MAVGAVIADSRPAQPVRRRFHRGCERFASLACQAVGTVEHQELPVWIALIVIEHHRHARGVLFHDVGLPVILVRQTFVAQRLFPVDTVGRFGIAQHLTRVKRVAGQGLDVPHLEFPVFRVLDRAGRKRVVVYLPRQVADLENWLFGTVRFGDHPFHILKVINDKVVQKQLFLRTDVEKRNLVIGHEVRILPAFNRAPARQRVVDLPLDVQRFGEASLFRFIRHVRLVLLSNLDLELMID